MLVAMRPASASGLGGPRALAPSSRKDALTGKGHRSVRTAPPHLTGKRLHGGPSPWNDSRRSCRHRMRVCAQRDGSEEDTPREPEDSTKELGSLLKEGKKKVPRRQADSTDWIASALTRRFGLAGGLAWLGFLTFGVVSEQVKTRMEVANEERNVKDVTTTKEVTTPSGLKYTDIKIGGGSKPVRGYLTVVDFTLSAAGEVLYDTRQRGKPLVYLYGSRPFTNGICIGVEEGLAGMKAGGRRLLVVPPELAFGPSPETIGDVVVPANTELRYDVSLQRISIPPS